MSDRALSGQKGPSIVTKRGDALALAVELSSGDEAYLGPTDKAIVVEALHILAASKRGPNLTRLSGAFLGGLTLAFVALASADTLRSTVASGKEPLAGIQESSARFEDVMKTIKPVQHVSPEAIRMQTFSAGYVPNDG
jgi:hypothetical protein